MSAPSPPVALTIAGSDPSGGAGIQADLKTFHAFRVYGAAVVTMLTVQDTTAVHDLLAVPPAFVTAQLDAVRDDLEVRAAKTGLLGRAAIVDAVAAHLRACPLPLVVDPVMVASTGRTLSDPAALAVVRAALLPLASVVTPNLAEAAALTGRPVGDLGTMRDAARALVDMGAGAALVTGGHLPGAPIDVLYADGAMHDLSGERIGSAPTHGTGCTLSAAIAAGMAGGDPLERAVDRARRFVARAIATAPAVGHGRRPLDHLVRPDEA